MPDVNYIITIRHEGGSGGSGGTSPGVAPTVSGESATGDGNVIGDLYGAYQKATKIAPIAFAMKLIDSTVTREINRVELRTGHSTYQERISWSYGVAKRTLLTGALLIGGIATGNPVAIGGAVLSAANRGIELIQAAEDLRISRAVEDVGIDMANIRAGSYGDRGRRDGY